VGLKLNAKHQLLAYADDVNLLGDNIDTIEKSTETLINASREVGLEINVEKTKYMLLSRHHNACQNRDIEIANRSGSGVSSNATLVLFSNRYMLRSYDPVHATGCKQPTLSKQIV
jgi:hypothetical protein